MAITRIYTSTELSPKSTIQLDQPVSHHLIRVLRLKTEAKLHVFNGNGYEYAATIVEASQKKCVVSIDEQTPCHNESPLKITLLQGLSRNDRMDVCIQKSTELGVTRITPYTSERTSAQARGKRNEKKHEHWQRVSISACEQSGRCTLPIIDPVISFHDAVILPTDATKLILNPEEKNSLKQHNKPCNEIRILIGPESGLTSDEIDLAHRHGYGGIRFGNRILRTETAGPAFISAIQTLWGDMG